MKYVYKYSAFGQMRDRIAEKNKIKKPSKVPYKTIMAMSERKNS